MHVVENRAGGRAVFVRVRPYTKTADENESRADISLKREEEGRALSFPRERGFDAEGAVFWIGFSWSASGVTNIT